MPRVALTVEQKVDYKLLDFKIWVVGQMKRNHMTQTDIGKALNLSQAQISQKLKVPDKNKRDKVKSDTLSYGQALILCNLFEATDKEKIRLLTL